MIRRFFWFVLGVLSGAWLLFYLREKTINFVNQATPAPLRRFTGARPLAPVVQEQNAARALGRTWAEARFGLRDRVSTFVTDVRLAAAEREAELRDELDLPTETA